MIHFNSDIFKNLHPNICGSFPNHQIFLAVGSNTLVGVRQNIFSNFFGIVFSQYLRILHMQVNTFFKYLLNTHEYYLNTYQYCHNTCEYCAGECTLKLLNYLLSDIFIWSLDACKECKFPFKYQGITFNSCTDYTYNASPARIENRLWCPFEVSKTIILLKHD